jgi:asparagine synthase (glutamine-hydrolysing)
MLRSLAGSLDGTGRGAHRVTGVGRFESVLRDGPLCVAFDGPELSAGNPVCLLDGFIDDARQLARDLGLTPDTPAEQLLAAGYRRWGRGLPARLRGDFAIVIWDKEHGEGLIARDQLGVRGLYLHDASGTLFFASELHLLLELLPATPGPDRTGVAHWIAASARPGAATLYQGVRRLNPGSMLLLDRRGNREQAYWRPRFREPQELDRDQAMQQVRAALDTAVQRRLDGAGRVAVLMSGGLDSASVAALASELAPQQTSAYAGCFPEHPMVDESALIAELRGKLALPGRDVRVHAGGLVHSAIESATASRLPQLGWGDFWTVPLLRAAAADGVQMTLGGDGGDELFGARAQLMADLLRAGHPLRATSLARELPGAGASPSRRAIARVLGSMLPDALPAALGDPSQRIALRRQLPPWLLAASARELLASERPSAWTALDGPRWWSHAAYGLTRGVEEIGIFEHQRLRARLAGVEARHPLFDLDLMQLMLAQPPRLSFDPHLNRPLLRGAMQGLLPDSVRLRPGKAWFDSLIVDSLVGPDAGAVRALLGSPSAELRAFAAMDSVIEMLDRGPGEGSERFTWMHLTWRLVAAECWLRRLVGDPAIETVDAPRPRVALLSVA